MSDALAREIINNTTLSAGQMLDIVDVSKVRLAVEDGLVSQAAADFAFQLSQSNQPLPTPGGGSGGGGGGSGGGSDPEPEPDPDRSELTAKLDSLNSPQAGVISVRWSVSNTIISGGGQTVGGTAEITVDGQTVETAVVNVPPGGEQGGRVALGDVTPGTREVCVRLQ